MARTQQTGHVRAPAAGRQEAKRSAGTASRMTTAKAQSATKRKTAAKTATTQKQAARNTSASNRTTTKRKAAAKTSGKQRAQRGEAPPSAGNAGRPQGRAAPSLRPIRKRETVSQLIAGAVADTTSQGLTIDRRTGTAFNSALMNRLMRHVMRGGSGYTVIPGLNAALWRGRTPAQKERKMASPILGGRIITIPGKLSHPTPRFRAYRPLRDIVARV